MLMSRAVRKDIMDGAAPFIVVLQNALKPNGDLEEKTSASSGWLDRSHVFPPCIPSYKLMGNAKIRLFPVTPQHVFRNGDKTDFVHSLPWKEFHFA